MSTPDQGIKKIIIPKSELPGFLGKKFIDENGDLLEINKYILRYRFISEDKNRTSHWSPAYKINAQDTAQEILNSMIVNTNDKIINLVWQPQNNVSEYHIYVWWNNDLDENGDPDWQYYAATTSTNYSIVYPTSKTYVKIAVQVKTIPLQRFVSATLFENEGSLI